MVDSGVTEHKIYFQWVFANGWSEMAGLGVTAFLGWLMSTRFESDNSLSAIIAGGLIFIVGGTLLEGVLVGYAQGRVIKNRIPGLPLQNWVIATAIGACIAWILGMIPSTLASLNEMGQTADPNPPRIFEGFIKYALAAIMGLVLGPILGTPQWVVLRRYFRSAGLWVPANALAWAVGMMIVFGGAGMTPVTASPLLIAALVCGTCLVAGLAVGAIHGLALIRIMRDGKQLSSA